MGSSFNFPTRTISPAGATNGSDLRFAYDATTGNRDWQQDGPADSTRVRFYYYASSGLPRSIHVPTVSPPDSFAYDATRGNLSWQRAPNSAVTNRYTDVAGRDTMVTIPISGGVNGRVMTTYDLMDRVTKTVSWGPAMGGNPSSLADSVVVTTIYDAEGNPTSINRTRGVHASGTLTTTMQYDGAGRKTYQSQSGRQDTYVYDLAGNLTQHQAPLGTISFKYDDAGQLLRRIVPQKSYGQTNCTWFTNCMFSFPTISATSVCVPADTARFGYDAAGRIVRADNGRARVRRSYKPNGLIATDTLRLRTYYSSGPSPCETDPAGEWPPPILEWTQHNYVLQYTYDLDGRRTLLSHPQGSVAYTYDNAGRSLLANVSDQGYTSHSFAYDAAGRLKTITHPGSVTDSRIFNADGSLRKRTVGPSGNPFINDTLITYDLRGLITEVRSTLAVPATMSYTGLGAVKSADHFAGTGPSAETFKVDAIGNRLRRSQPGLKPQGDPDYEGIRFFGYDTEARLTSIVDTTVSNDNFTFSESLSYDAAGALELGYSREWQNYPSTTNIYDQSRNYAGIDGKVAATNRHLGISSVSDDIAGRHGVYQEHWYDALGRRVLVRARKTGGGSCNTGTYGELACKSYIERVVWDGDQILIERRADGAANLNGSALEQETSSGSPYGTVVSIHAGGIDAPVAVRKAGGTTVIPHANWQGSFMVGTLPNGNSTTTCGGGTDTCPNIIWPGKSQTVDGLLTAHDPINQWWGSLIADKLDASGYKYMRNRYYNPAKLIRSGWPVGSTCTASLKAIRLTAATHSVCARHTTITTGLSALAAGSPCSALAETRRSEPSVSTHRRG